MEHGFKWTEGQKKKVERSDFGMGPLPQVWPTPASISVPYQGLMLLGSPAGRSKQAQNEGRTEKEEQNGGKKKRRKEETQSNERLKQLRTIKMLTYTVF